MKSIAIAGCGFIGRIHAARILRNPSLELCALVDRDAGQIAEMLRTGGDAPGADKIDVARLANVPTFDSVEACLGACKVDILDVCVPTRGHCDSTRAALERGVHVLLEKPFTLDVAQARSLIDLAAERKLQLMVAHVVRFMPEYGFVARAAAEGTYGPLEFLSLERRIGRPSWGDWSRAEDMQKSSGGALFDLQIHDIDFAQSLLGSPTSIDCKASPDARICRDHVHAVWKYDSGASVVIQGGFHFHGSTPFEARLLARFENATIEFTSRAPGCVVVSTHDASEVVALPTTPDGFDHEIEYFRNCVASGSKPEKCTPESSLRSIELCHLHLKSVKEGVSVDV